MSIQVNPPPQVRLPDKIFNDPELRGFFESWQTILFQLWNRTGGSTDTVAGKQNITLISSDTVLDDNAFGSLLIVEADTGPLQITLPTITNERLSEIIDIAIIDATFDTTIVPPGSETILGDTSVIMNQQFMSIQFTTITTEIWIGT